MKTFDVVIVDTKTNKIEAVIGRNLSERKAEQRVMTGVSRTNIGPYCVVDVKHDPNRKEGDKLK